MERFVAEQNVARYHELLAGDLAPEKRAIIEKLLADEETKLAALPARAQPAALNPPGGTAKASEPSG